MVEEGEEKARAARLPAGGFNVPLRNFVGPINTGWRGGSFSSREQGYG